MVLGLVLLGLVSGLGLRKVSLRLRDA